MIRATVEVHVNRAEMRRSEKRQALKFINDVNAEIATRARRLAPKASGGLRASIRVERAKVVGDRVTGRVVAFAKHAVYQHEGTGIYGPRGVRIRPRSRQALRFYWRKAGGVVFFRSVRGTKPTKFLTRAMAQVLADPRWRVIYLTRPF